MFRTHTHPRHVLAPLALLAAACLLAASHTTLHAQTSAPATAPARAQQAPAVKPGLWEFQQKMQSASGQMEQAMQQMQQQMAALPPEQRKMMEAMMARQGVNVAPGAGGAMTVRMCLTPEMVQRNQMPVHAQGDCRTEQSPRSGNTMRVKFTCANPPSSGDGEVTFVGDSAYTMKMTVNTTAQGRPEKITMDGSGKWLGADCGAVKPLAAPTR